MNEKNTRFFEIERKFLVKNDAWKNDFATSKKQKIIVMKQGYFAPPTPKNHDENIATIRIRLENQVAKITIKGRPTNDGLKRLEFEYEISQNEAELLLENFCGNRIVQKTRYIFEKNGVEWSIDLFEGRHQGLVIAEVELPSVDTKIPLPQWLEKEVTGDLNYSNEILASDI